MKTSFPARLVLACFAAVLLFALVFTVVNLRSGWPGLPYEALRDVDLAAGFSFVGAVILHLLRAGRRDGSN